FSPVLSRSDMVGPMSRFSVLGWPVLRQTRSKDMLGRGPSVESQQDENMRSRTEDADDVVQSVCPYCAVGCGKRIYVKDNEVIHIEGDPDSPVSRGRLCPKGAASEQLVNTPSRQKKILYRRPYGTDWEELELETAMDMIVDRLLEARDNHWEDVDEHGSPVNRTMGIASLGGATIGNEEQHLIKKLFSAAGAVQIERQAGIGLASNVPSLGTSFGRGGATQPMQDMGNADLVWVQGSNMAEAHPVGFQWVAEAKQRGAKLIHVDPRFTRTSALADKHVHIRAGSDIVLLGGLIHHMIENDLWFEDYVVHYTNAAHLIDEGFAGP